MSDFFSPDAVPSGRTIILIGFGDSMIFGYLVGRSECWTSLLQSGTSFRVINRGVNGDTTAGMIRRFDSQVTDVRPLPDAVLFLAGTNDFIAGTSARQVFRRLLFLAQKAEASGIRPFLLTIPPYRTDMMPVRLRHELHMEKVSEQRRSFNEMLRLSSYCLDFASAFESETDDAAERLYIDGVHLNADGHKKAAAFLQPHLLNFFRKEF